MISKYHKEGIQYRGKFQEEAVYHSAKNKKSICCLPVGSGKTFVALTLYAIALERGKYDQCIFVTRKSVVQQIPTQIDKFLNDVSYISVYNDKPKKRQIKYDKFFNEKINILVCSHENIKFDNKHFLNRDLSKVILIIDEAIVIKNQTSAYYKMYQKISNKVKRVLALTGSPSYGKLEDVNNIAKCIGASHFSNSEFNRSFVKWTKKEIYMRPYLKNRSGSVKRDANGRAMRAKRVEKVKVNSKDGYRNLALFHSKMKDVIFSRKKSEVTDIPPFTLKYYILPKNKDVENAYKSVYKEYGSGCSYGVLAIAGTSPSLILENDKVSSKEKEVIRILDEVIEKDEKVIIYSAFSKPLLNLKKELDKRCKTNLIFGKTKDREKEKQEFIENGKVMLMTSAGEMGVDGLQVANHIIIVIPQIMGGALIQLAGRISRIGTKHNELFIHVVMNEDSIDTDVWSIVQNQLVLIKKLTPDVIDDGLIDENLMVNEIQTIDEVNEWMKKKITNRSRKYIK